MTAESPEVEPVEETIVPVKGAEKVTDRNKHTPVPPETTTADGDETVVKPLNKHTP